MLVRENLTLINGLPTDFRGIFREFAPVGSQREETRNKPRESFMLSPNALHNRIGDFSAARAGLAAGAIAALVVLGACAENGSSITAPTRQREATITTDYYGSGKHVDLCVDASSPPGNYIFYNSHENDGLALPGYGVEWPVGSGIWSDQGDGGDDNNTVFNAPSGSPTTNTYVVAAGTCVRLIERTQPDADFAAGTHALDGWSAVTTTYVSNNAGAVHTNTNCVNDLGVIPAQPDPCGATTTTVRAFANWNHGTDITFFFTPPEEVIPLFVIGDIEPHAINDVVNFWGAQWWKNNPMSQFHNNGWLSFKGFASSVDLTPSNGNPCGTWTSRVGNSPPPPQTIPEFVGIIVTNNVIKSGPDLTGGIQQIIIVHSDGGYGPNPGHDGNGPVTSISCPAT